VLIQKQRISKIRGELGAPIAPLFRVFNPSHELFGIWNSWARPTMMD
jgi:hypothetical protein